MNESCHASKQVTSDRQWRVARVHESCHTYKWVMSHVSIGDATVGHWRDPGCHQNACSTLSSGWFCMCDLTHQNLWLDSFLHAAWLIYTCGMNHSFIRAAWLIHTCDMTLLYSLVLGCYIRNTHTATSETHTLLHPKHTHCYIRNTHTGILVQLSHFKWDSYAWTDLFARATWIIYMCDMPHSYVTRDVAVNTMQTLVWLSFDTIHMWHDSFICVTWLIYMCDLTHSYVWHDSFIYTHTNP